MDQSLPSVVEKEVNARIADSTKRVEVINTGTSSYSPLIFYTLARYVIHEYQPDLLFLIVDMTDALDDWKYRMTAVYDEEGNPWAVPPREIYRSPFVQSARGIEKISWMHKAQLFLFSHSHAYNLFLQTVRSSMSIDKQAPPKIEGGKWFWIEQNPTEEDQKEIEKTLDVLRRLFEWSKQNGIDVAMTSVPHYWQYHSEADGTGSPRWPDTAHVLLRELAKKQQLPYFDSFSTLKPYVTGSAQPYYYYRGDMHFNPRGYAVWSKYLAEFFLKRENQLLPLWAYPQGELEVPMKRTFP